MSRRYTLSFNTLSAQDIAEALGKARRTGDGWKALCPCHDDATPSLSLTMRDGRLLVKCHAGCKQSDVIEALCQRGLFGGAVKRDADARLPDAPVSYEGRVGYASYPTPPQELEPRFYMGEGVGKFKQAWAYRDRDGHTAFWVARYEARKGKGKTIRPWTYDARERDWIPRAPPSPRLLYGTERLYERPKADVVVVEGEKTCDAARKLLPSYVVVTWQGGTGAVDYAQWEVLKGRRVTVWPDADEPGQKAAREIVKHLWRIGVEAAHVVRLPLGLPPGWDLADAWPEGIKGDAESYVLSAEKQSDGFTRMSEVTRERVEWLWKPFIARGEVCLVDGDPSVGKSYFMYMAAKGVCDGDKMPNGWRMRRGSVIYFTMEDDKAKVIKGRLIDNGCKHMQNFIVYDQPFLMDDAGFDWIVSQVKRYKPSLLVFDLLPNYIGRTDMAAANEVSQMMTRFALLARSTGVAVCCVRHLTKGGRDKAIYRGIGSIAFTGTARTVLMIGRLPDDPEVRVVALAKSNIGAMSDALTYTIEEVNGGGSRLVWGDMMSVDPSDVLAESTKEQRDAAADRMAEAEDFLEGLVTAEGTPVRDIEDEAERRSINSRTLKRAKRRMRIVSVRRPGGWYWQSTVEKHEKT